MSDNQGGVQLEKHDTIAIITLQRPEKLNALTPAMLRQLAQHARNIDDDPTLRVAILTASGERAFCVGADIHIWSSLSALDMWRNWVRKGHRVFDQLASLRVPLVAAINGHAFGGGLELLATADIRLTDKTACFALPEAGIATCPGWSGTQRLVRLMGVGAVKYMALTGKQLSASQALACGLVQEISPPGKVMEQALTLAGNIASKAPVAVQLTRQIIDAGNGVDTAMTLEALAGALAATTSDAKEGLASFAGRRTAHFRGE